jgi:hypothetical protein
VQFSKLAVLELDLISLYKYSYMFHFISGLLFDMNARGIRDTCMSTRVTFTYRLSVFVFDDVKR